MTDRLTRQITFLVEADKLKNIIRRTPLVDSSRLEKIDAGDTFAYDTEGHTTKAERELGAAARIFGLLPLEAAMPGVWPHVLDVIESFCSAGVIRRTSDGRS